MEKGGGAADSVIAAKLKLDRKLRRLDQTADHIRRERAQRQVRHNLVQSDGQPPAQPRAERCA